MVTFYMRHRVDLEICSQVYRYPFIMPLTQIKQLLNRMDRQELESFTKNYQHHGCNSQNILDQFVKYLKICSDPLLILRHMEEKAICTFMPGFWIQKAFILAELGNYSLAFQSLEEAELRTEQTEAATFELIKKHEIKIRTKMVEEMRMFPTNERRSMAQFSDNLMKDDISLRREKQSMMIKLYQQKYGELRNEIERKAMIKLNKLPNSWLFELYKKEDEIEQMIEDQIHENSVKMSRDFNYHTMHTPMVKRDHQRLIKTMDSVDLMKKRKSTRQKMKKDKNTWEQDDSQLDQSFEDQSDSMMVVSMPVGRKFSKLKRRRVTFKTGQKKFQLPRECQDQTQSLVIASKQKTEVRMFDENKSKSSLKQNN